MRHLLYLVFLFYVLIENCRSIRLHLGRPVDKYGMLGLPNTDKQLLSSIHQDIPDQWFEQRLDHFDPPNLKTWKQRYFVNEEFFNRSANAPIFFQFGGEGIASPVWLKEGQIASNYGKYYQAFLVLLEHRFYGKSHPTKDMSTANLKYLTSEQALQDAATFIQFLRKKYNLVNNKLIVFGGSYPGSLSAWFRLKYPHLADGAIASSAPVKAILDFTDYLAVVDQSLGPECVSHIRSATDRITQMLMDKNQWESLTTKFKLCTPLNGTNKWDVYSLMSNLADNFEGVVQYNKDNRIGHSKTANITIETLCNIMTDVNSYQDPTDRLAQVNKLMLEVSCNECLEYKYDNFLKQMLNTNFDETPIPGARQWTYQTCTEFGFFQTSDKPDQPFGDYFPLEFFIKMCQDSFGTKFDQKFIQNGIDFSNNNYGGLNLTLTNVVFPNGVIDPWHALGVLKQINPTAFPLLIEGTAHCADMYPDSPDDPPQLTNARKIIKKSIGEFIHHS